MTQKGHFQSKTNLWLRLKKIWMCLTCKTRCFWEVSDIDYPKFSARDQGVTYPGVGSSFLFQLQGGQTRIPSWWKRTWKMEGRIRKDQEPFLQYEVNHLYHWYGLSLSFLHLSNMYTSFMATSKGINLASIHVSCAHFVHVFLSCVLVYATAGHLSFITAVWIVLVFVDMFLLLFGGKQISIHWFIVFHTIILPINGYRSVHQITVQHTMDLYHSFSIFVCLVLYLNPRNLTIK